jgi:hypothetical protein
MEPGKPLCYVNTFKQTRGQKYRSGVFYVFAPRPLLGSIQRPNGLAGYIGTPTDMHATIELFSVRGPFREDVRTSVVQLGRRVAVVDSCVEAGSNTSAVTLRVVGGDEMGSLESEAVKYIH